MISLKQNLIKVVTTVYIDRSIKRTFVKETNKKNLDCVLLKGRTQIYT